MISLSSNWHERRISRLHLISIAICTSPAFNSPFALADVIAISASKDNTLYQDEFGSLSNGAGEHFFAGINANGAIRRGLIAFDIAGQVPAGATIENATLTLHMSRTATAIEPVNLHRVVANWGEGASRAFNEEGAGAAAMPPDSTWLHTFYDWAFWTNPGGDFEPAPSAQQLIGGVGFYGWSSSGLVADVQSWLDTPNSDFGWIVLGDEAAAMTAKRFDSRESSDPSFRPLLTVEYTTVPEPKLAMLGLFLLLRGHVKVGRSIPDVVGGIVRGNRMICD